MIICAVLEAVRSIFLAGCPAKIVRLWICSIAVIMRHIMAIGTRPVESRANQKVNGDCAAKSASLSQSNLRISRLKANTWFPELSFVDDGCRSTWIARMRLHPHAIQTPYPPKRTCFVTLSTRDGSPLFGINDIGFVSHGRTSNAFVVRAGQRWRAVPARFNYCNSFLSAT